MLNIFLISDSTGETAEQLARAALAQFNGIDARRSAYPQPWVPWTWTWSPSRG